MKILIADDEKTLTNMLREILRQNKIDCDIVFNGQDAVDFAKASEYDLIILDIGMPKLNGIDALKQIRQNKISTPILMLSAKAETSDKVGGLECGADDYLTKPFATSELLARIKALTRRKGEYVGNTLSFVDLILDKDTFMLNSISSLRNTTLDMSADASIKLSNTEYKIMELLLNTPQAVIHKERMIEKVWGWDNNADYNNVEVYISFLRKKIEALKSKVIIKAVRGVGYCLGCENG